MITNTTNNRIIIIFKNKEKDIKIIENILNDLNIIFSESCPITDAKGIKIFLQKRPYYIYSHIYSDELNELKLSNRENEICDLNKCSYKELITFIRHYILDESGD